MLCIQRTPITCSTPSRQQRGVTQARNCKCSAAPQSNGRRGFLSSAAAGAYLLANGSLQRALADEQPAANPAEALIGTLQKTEEDLRFEGTDLVKSLLARSDLNREQNKKELANKYCLRQAEDGVGDCAGLRLIPGATRSGKQKTPGFLKKILRIEDKEE